MRPLQCFKWALLKLRKLHDEKHESHTAYPGILTHKAKWSGVNRKHQNLLISLAEAAWGRLGSFRQSRNIIYNPSTEIPATKELISECCKIEVTKDILELCEGLS